MRILNKIGLGVVLLLNFNLINAAEWESNVALTNDYVWRGMTQSNEEPAISGGFDIAADNGLYFGTWGSSIEFGGDSAAMELDYYFGFANETESGLSYDLGFISYTYPGDDDADFEEVFLGLGYSFENISAGITFSSGQEDAANNTEFSLSFGDSGLGVTYGDYEDTGKYSLISYDLPITLAGLSISIGWSDFDAEAEGADEDTFVVTFSM